MQYGINTLLWTAAFDDSHTRLFPQIKQGGFDGVEIARFEFGSFPVKQVRRSLEANGLQGLVCTALTGEQSLVSDDADVRRRTRDFLLDGIRMVAELGGDTMVGPFCSAVGYLCGRRRTEDEWKRAVEGLQSLTSSLDQYQVTLAVEPLNRFETFFLNTTADAVELCKQVAHPRVGILFDTFHANIEEKDIGAALESGGEYIKHVHTCENDRGTPGSGHVEWPSVFAALKAIRYDKWLVIESFGSAMPELAKAACIWRDLAPTSDEIAYEGVQFLKRA